MKERLFTAAISQVLTGTTSLNGTTVQMDKRYDVSFFDRSTVTAVQIAAV